jgi:hypothetical protein
MRIDWGRVLAGGIVAGLVWTLLSLVLLGLVGREFMGALTGGNRAPDGNVQGFMFAANMAHGVWGTWLYAAIRAHFGPGLRTGALAGVVWWIGVSLQSAKWFSLSGAPVSSVVGPGALTIPAILVAAITGGWAYETFTGLRRVARTGQP